MKPKNTSIQPDLFEQDEPRVLPVLSQKEQLATLVVALLNAATGQTIVANFACGLRAEIRDAQSTKIS